MSGRLTGRSLRIARILCVAGFVIFLLGCEPTGPTPIEYTVPTAMKETPTPALIATLPVSPSPALPTATLTEPAPPQATNTPIVTREGWNVFSLAPGGRVVTPAVGENSVLWVAPAGGGLGLFVQNLQTGETQLLAEPSTAGGCVCRGYRRGEWVAMIETQPAASWWEVSALNVAAGERTTVGRTEDPAVASTARPGEMAVNAEGQVVWQDLTTGTDGSVLETLRISDAVSGRTSEVISVRSPVRIGRVTMHGDWVVWNQATAGEAGTRGDVFAYNLESDELFPIGETGRAWEPAIWGTTVAWKHADGPFADGDVFLFDLETSEGRLLTEDGQVSGVGVGDGFVAWSSAVAGVVVRHDLEAGTDDVVGRGPVGWLAAGGNTIAWLMDDDPQRLHVAWRR